MTSHVVGSSVASITSVMQRPPSSCRAAADGPSCGQRGCGSLPDGSRAPRGPRRWRSSARRACRSRIGQRTPGIAADKSATRASSARPRVVVEPSGSLQSAARRALLGTARCRSPQGSPARPAMATPRGPRPGQPETSRSRDRDHPDDDHVDRLPIRSRAPPSPQRPPCSSSSTSRRCHSYAAWKARSSRCAGPVPRPTGIDCCN